MRAPPAAERHPLHTAGGAAGLTSDTWITCTTTAFTAAAAAALVVAAGVFEYLFLTSGLEEQPAIMSRAPEDVSKLTENAYKVSEST